MNFTNLTRIAANALKRNKFRAFLTMLGIIIGVGSVIGMLSIGESSKQSIQEEMSSMGTNMIFITPGDQERGGIVMGNTNAKTLKLDDVEKIKKEALYISAISPVVSSTGQAINGNKNWPTTIYGTNSDYLGIRKFELKDGRLFKDREIKTLAKVCLIGQTVVENLFEEGVDPIGQTIRFGDIPLKVIGVLEEKGENAMGMDQDDMLIAPYSSVQRRILAINYIQSIYMSAESEELSDEAMDEVESILRRAHDIREGDENDFEVRSQSEMISMFSNVTSILTMLLGAVAGISLLVGGIGIMNIMFVSVTERTREIGLRMSVGGRGIDILTQFLIEAILLSVFGGLIGILFGILISYVATSLLGYSMVIMGEAIFIAFLVCTVIGVFFGWYPARKAARLNPIDALRHE